HQGAGKDEHRPDGQRRRIGEYGKDIPGGDEAQRHECGGAGRGGDLGRKPFQQEAAEGEQQDGERQPGFIACQEILHPAVAPVRGPGGVALTRPAVHSSNADIRGPPAPGSTPTNNPRPCGEDLPQKGAPHGMASSNHTAANCREVPGTSPGMTAWGGGGEPGGGGPGRRGGGTGPGLQGGQDGSLRTHELA